MKVRAKVIAPSGRRRLWRVIVGPGVFTCDSEEIAKEVARRWRTGLLIGCVALELRQR